MTPLIQEPDIARALAKGLGIRERMVPSSIDETLIGVVIVKDLSQPDPFLNPVVRLCARGTIATPGAGLAAAVQLNNPSTSHVMAEVQQILISSNEVLAGPLVIEVCWGVSGQGTASSGVFLNRRLGLQVPACQLRFGDTFSNAGTIYSVATDAPPSWPMVLNFPPGFVVPPNEAVTVLTTLINQNLNVSFLWTEREEQLGR